MGKQRFPPSKLAGARLRWVSGWRARGWLDSAKKPVAIRDLWEPLINLVEERGDVTFRWVRATPVIR